jgi:hypothetical protein
MQQFRLYSELGWPDFDDKNKNRDTQTHEA